MYNQTVVRLTFNERAMLGKQMRTVMRTNTQTAMRTEPLAWIARAAMAVLMLVVGFMPMHAAAQTKYTVNYRSSDLGWGTVEIDPPGGIYDEGATVSVIATPKSGYYLLQWDNISNGLGEPTVVYAANYPELVYVFTVDKNYDIRAKFTDVKPAAQTYTITTVVEPDGAGAVTGGGSGLSGNVTLTAMANLGWVFKYWKENGSIKNPLTIDVTGDATYTAFFEKRVQLTLNQEGSGNGSVTGAGLYAPGATFEIEATPDANSKFAGWYEGGSLVSTEPKYTVTMGGNDRTLVAVFEAKQSYTVTLNVEPNEGGTVNGAGDYPEGENVVIKAKPNDGYSFDGWKDEGNNTISQELVYSFTISGSVNYTAVFKSTSVPQGTINVECIPAGSGYVVSGNVSQDEGSTVALEVAANAGYRFVEWQDGETQNPRTVTIVAGETTYTAKFEAIPTYDVNITIEPNEAFGVVSGAGNYSEGEEVVLLATPNQFYRFVGWKESGATIGTDAELRFNIDREYNLVAVFEEIPTYTVSAATAIEGGTVAGLGTYREGDMVTLIATPLEGGYTFVDWIINGATVSENPYQFTITENVSVEANFKAPHFEIIIETDGNGTVSPVSAEYPAGQSIDITATPNPGYLFKYWDSGEGTKMLSKQNPYRHMVKAAAKVRAVFIAKGDAPEGSEFNAITIENISDLSAFRDAVNTGGTYKLADLSNGAEGLWFAITADIDMSSASPWEPIGNGVEFKGNINGNFFTLSGLTVDAAEKAGLFGSIKGARIENLVLNNATVVSNANYAGAVCGYAENSEILNCVSIGLVHAMNYEAGGICGYALNSTIRGCASSGKVEAVGAQAGGICGFAVKNAVVSNCYNANMVSTQGSYAGGICGFIALGGSIDSCLNVGVVQAKYYGGAIVGSVYNSSSETRISNCFFDKQMSVFDAVDNKAQDGAVGLTTNELVGYATQVSLSTWMPSAQNYPMLEMLALEKKAFLMATTVPMYLNESENVGRILAGIVNLGDGTWSYDNSKIEKDGNVYKPINVGDTEDEFVLSEGGNNVKYIPVKLYKTNAIIITVNAINGSVVGLRSLYASGEKVSLMGKPDATYRVKGWYKNGVEVSSQAFYEFEATESCVLVLECDQTPCKLNVGVEGNGSTDKSGIVDCAYAETVTLTATPQDEHHLFAGWVVGGRTVSIKSTYTFTITSDIDITAKFISKPYYIKAIPDHLTHGSVKGSGSYSYGQEVTLTAMAYFGYTFVNWTDEYGAVLESSPNFKLTVERAMTVVANYTPALYDIKVLDAKGGSLLKEGKVNDMQSFHQQFGHGDDVTLVAQPLAGYAFVAWAEGIRDTVSRTPSYTFKALKSRTLRACFRWVGTVSGIEDAIAEPFVMNIYPNPATDRVVIEGSAMDMIVVFDLSGRPVYQSAPLGGETRAEVNVAGFMSGIYVVQVRDERGKQHTAKLVVR